MTQTVLYIEDNEVNSEIVSHILEREGFDVHICENGHDGILKAEELTPDLILVDLHLPGINGLEITQKLREMDTLENAKIVLLTADIYSREKAKNAGADDFMTKPIRRKAFLRQVNKIMERPTA